MVQEQSTPPPGESPTPGKVTITIETQDPQAAQDVENFLTGFYQRGVDVTHTTDVVQPKESHSKAKEK